MFQTLGLGLSHPMGEITPRCSRVYEALLSRPTFELYQRLPLTIKLVLKA
jgi:hypothetical protein